MTIRKLASLLARKEGKKTQARIGEIRELLAILSDLVYADSEPILEMLWSNGLARAKKKEKS